MESYKKSTISNDFKVSAKNVEHYIVWELEKIAIMILDDMRDNKARNMAISHLLSAANFIVLSHLKSITSRQT